MAVVITKEIKKKRILLVIFMALVLASAAILYFGIFSGGETTPAVAQPSPTIGGPAVAGQISDLKIKILEDDRFRNLQPPPGVPLKTETTGKSNPFSD